MSTAIKRIQNKIQSHHLYQGGEFDIPLKFSPDQLPTSKRGYEEYPKTLMGLLESKADKQELNEMAS